jgi:hypothetical protein
VAKLPDKIQNPGQAVLESPVSNAPVVVYTETPYRIWGQAEYLLWWVKDAPLPVPLVTTGNPLNGFPAVNSAGAIGQPDTQVLLGNSNVNFGSFSGMRFTLGAWIDNSNTVGVEGSAFLLERRSNRFFAASDPAGNPPLYLPAFNVLTQAERAVAVADPLRQFSGNVSVVSALQLWGGELNGVLNVGRRQNLEVNLLGGFRYADLAEHLVLKNPTTDLIFINTTTLTDYFGTRNQFYGGQLGARVSARRDRWMFDVTGKVALGDTHQVVNVNGSINQTGPGAFAPGTFPGGLYAQPTNIGQRSNDAFSVIPAVELKVGYQISQRVAVFAGYNFLYWSNVVRPGEQIDRNINPSQSPIFGGGALVGQAAPAPLFNHSDFWAHGVNFGLEVRY